MFRNFQKNKNQRPIIGELSRKIIMLHGVALSMKDERKSKNEWRTAKLHSQVSMKPSLEQ